jgi:hypothetical protein
MSHETPSWKPDDPWAECDGCGRDVRLSTLKKRWDGAMACVRCWEPLHPQERPAVPRDRQAVRNARPPQEINSDSYPFLVDENGDDIVDENEEPIAVR